MELGEAILAPPSSMGKPRWIWNDDCRYKWVIVFIYLIIIIVHPFLLKECLLCLVENVSWALFGELHFQQFQHSGLCNFGSLVGWDAVIMSKVFKLVLKLFVVCCMFHIAWLKLYWTFMWIYFLSRTKLAKWKIVRKLVGFSLIKLLWMNLLKRIL